MRSCHQPCATASSAKEAGPSWNLFHAPAVALDFANLATVQCLAPAVASALQGPKAPADHAVAGVGAAVAAGAADVAAAGKSAAAVVAVAATAVAAEVTHGMAVAVASVVAVAGAVAGEDGEEATSAAAMDASWPMSHEGWMLQ